MDELTLSDLQVMNNVQVYELLVAGKVSFALFESYIDDVFDEGVNEGVSNPYGP